MGGHCCCEAEGDRLVDVAPTDIAVTGITERFDASSGEAMVEVRDEESTDEVSKMKAGRGKSQLASPEYSGIVPSAVAIAVVKGNESCPEPDNMPIAPSPAPEAAPREFEETSTQPISSPDDEAKMKEVQKVDLVEEKTEESPGKEPEKGGKLVLPPITTLSQSTRTESGETFTITLQAGPGKKMGFRIAHRPGEHKVHIVEVSAVGALPDWNKANPDKQVTPGCRILAINDHQLEAKQEADMKKGIIEACQSPVATMLIQKSSGASAPATPMTPSTPKMPMDLRSGTGSTN